MRTCHWLGLTAFVFYTKKPSLSSFKYMDTVLALPDYLKNASCNRNRNQRIPISDSAVRFLTIANLTRFVYSTSFNYRGGRLPARF